MNLAWSLPTLLPVESERTDTFSNKATYALLKGLRKEGMHVVRIQGQEATLTQGNRCEQIHNNLGTRHRTQIL